LADWQIGRLADWQIGRLKTCHHNIGRVRLLGAVALAKAPSRTANARNRRIGSAGLQPCLARQRPEAPVPNTKHGVAKHVAGHAARIFVRRKHRPLERAAPSPLSVTLNWPAWLQKWRRQACGDHRRHRASLATATSGLPSQRRHASIRVLGTDPYELASLYSVQSLQNL
jgi:hypothetical protein